MQSRDCKKYTNYIIKMRVKNLPPCQKLIFGKRGKIKQVKLLPSIPKLEFFWHGGGRIIIVFLLSIGVSFSPVSSKKTFAWTEIPGQIFKQTLEKIDYNLNGIILGTLKMQAARMLDQQVSKLIGGTVGSGAMFITNWESFLITEPQRQADRYVNDYLSQLTRGRGSYSSYISVPRSYVLGASDSKNNEGFFGGKVLGSDDETTTAASSENYYGEMLNTGKSATTERKEPEITYEGDPSQMLSEKNFSKFNLYLSPTAVNSKFAMGLVWAPYKQEQYLKNQEKIAATQSIAYEGYKGTMRNGMIVTPGSLTAQTMANVQDMGNKIIAAATHPAEIISSVVSNIVTKAMLSGIGAVSSVVDRQVNQVTDKVVNEVNGNLSKYGPGSLYNSSSSGRYRY